MKLQPRHRTWAETASRLMAQAGRAAKPGPLYEMALGRTARFIVSKDPAAACEAVEALGAGWQHASRFRAALEGWYVGRTQ